MIEPKIAFANLLVNCHATHLKLLVIEFVDNHMCGACVFMLVHLKNYIKFVLEL